MKRVVLSQPSPRTEELNADDAVAVGIPGIGEAAEGNMHPDFE